MYSGTEIWRWTVTDSILNIWKLIYDICQGAHALKRNRRDFEYFKVGAGAEWRTLKLLSGGFDRGGSDFNDLKFALKRHWRKFDRDRGD